MQRQMPRSLRITWEIAKPWTWICNGMCGSVQKLLQRYGICMLSSDKPLGQWTSLTGARVACVDYAWKLPFLCCVIKKYATKGTNKPALSLGVHSFPE
jgi:hypothetical protein